MKWWILSLSLFITSCQITQTGGVTVGKQFPGSHCREVGQVIGMANTRTNPYERALADLRYETAVRDGNYVRILAVAAYGASIRGMAYQCR